MKFEEALQAMREGKKIRQGHCKCGFIIDVSPHYSCIIDNEGMVKSFIPAEILSEEWEIVE